MLFLKEKFRQTIYWDEQGWLEFESVKDELVEIFSYLREINFDNMNLSEKKEILGKYLGAKSLIGYSDSKIEKFFKMRIGAVVKELEKDISVPS